ncbi:hypothetical protein L9Z73_20750, partial [Pseudomonas sp. TNT11]|nr:hypothetical protein [Pseudomonas emilianonis]
RDSNYRYWSRLCGLVDFPTYIFSTHTTDSRTYPCASSHYGSDLRRLGTCVRLSRQCRHTLQVNVIIGLGWTLAIVVFAAFGWLGAAGAMIAAVLHNLSTLLVLGNAGRLLRFQEPLSKLEK